MHAHFVLAHPEPQSFNAHLVRSGAAALEAEGWTVSVSDLYAIGFDPCERPEFYTDRTAPARFDVHAEQRHATATGMLPKVVTDELARMDQADLLVLQYPMWWHLPPAILKGWFDRVLAYGEALTSRPHSVVGEFLAGLCRLRCARAIRGLRSRGRSALFRARGGRGPTGRRGGLLSRRTAAGRRPRGGAVQSEGRVGARMAASCRVRQSIPLSSAGRSIWILGDADDRLASPCSAGPGRTSGRDRRGTLRRERGTRRSNVRDSAR